MVKIPMIYTGSKKINVENVGEIVPEKGKPFKEVCVPLKMANNLARDKYWAWAKAEPPAREDQPTQPQPPGKPEEKKDAPVIPQKPGEEKEKDKKKEGGKKK